MPAFVSGSSLIKVTDYGALVDGATNDTTSVQSAANAAGGKTLYFPEGTTSVSTITLQPNTNVVGNGPTSIIKQRALSAGVGSPIFTAANNCSISGLKLDGNGVTNEPDSFSDSYNDAAVAGNNYKTSTGRGRGYRCGIRGEAITGLTVANVEFTAMAGACVATNMTSRILITGCYAHDTFWELAYIFGSTSPSYAATSGQNVVITGNTLADIVAPAAAASGGYEPDGIVMSRVNGFEVSENVLTEVDRDFLKLESCKYGIVARNLATNLTSPTNYPGMQISPMFGHESTTSETIRVCYNTFTGPGFGNGIQVNSSDSLVAITRNIEVDHNTVTGGMVNGIVFDGATGLLNINVHHNALNGTTNLCLSGFAGGGTGLFITTNTNDGVPIIPDINTPGAWSSYFDN